MEVHYGPHYKAPGLPGNFVMVKISLNAGHKIAFTRFLVNEGCISDAPRILGRPAISPVD